MTAVSPDRIRVVHQGVDHSHYRPTSTEKARERLGLDATGPYILIVSSNLPHKRVDEATDILDHVRTAYPDAQLLKAGYGETVSGEHVVNTGWIPEDQMPLLYNAADVYLHPSEYEGFGLPIVEAMACGTPVVARKVASVPELVGDSLDLVAPGADPKQIGAAVVTHLDEFSSPRTIVEHSKQFTWEKTARKTKNVYENL